MRVCGIVICACALLLTLGDCSSKTEYSAEHGFSTALIEGVEPDFVTGSDRSRTYSYNLSVTLEDAVDELDVTLSGWGREEFEDGSVTWTDPNTGSELKKRLVVLSRAHYYKSNPHEPVASEYCSIAVMLFVYDD